MSKTPKNRKYVELEKVRVYLNKKTGNIQIITADPDLVGEPFQISLTQGTPTEKTLRDLLISKEVISFEQVAPELKLPKYVPYPNEDGSSPSPHWNLFPLGVSYDEETVEVNMLKAPHTIIVGPTGGGKTVVQRNFLRHALTHNDVWRIITVDLRKVGLSWLAPFEKSLLGAATSFEEALQVLQSTVELIEKRLHLMEKQGTADFRDLEDDSFALMVVIDEVASLLSYDFVSADLNPSRTLIKHFLEIIAERGALAGVHLLMSTQSYDPETFNPLSSYNTTKILMGGKMDSTRNQLFTETEEKMFDGIKMMSYLGKGRGYILSAGLMTAGVSRPCIGVPLQAYFSKVD